MIKFETGNILNSTSQCLINTVNCEGFMGKGIAYQFKEKFSENNKNYVTACKKGEFTVGKILFFKESGKIIANFPTKNKWKEKSQYSFIDSGLQTLTEKIKENHITSIAIPPLGCGNGGLDWNIVKSKILNSFKGLNIEVTIFEPSKQFTSQKVEIPKMSASHLILMKLKDGLECAKFNKLRIQKAAYLVNVFSNTDYFKFEEYKFGPYAHSIEILSKQIKAFQETYNVNTKKAEEILYKNIISDSVKNTVEKYKTAVAQSVSFVNSITSDKELEIITTIIAIVIKNPQFNDEEIINYFFNSWGKYDVERFSKEEIKLSVEKMVKKGLLIPQLIGYTISLNK